MNRRGFIRSLGAGLITAAAVTRLATAKLQVAEPGIDDGIALNSMAHPKNNYLTEAALEELMVKMEGDFGPLNLRYEYIRYDFHPRAGLSYQLLTKEQMMKSFPLQGEI